MMPSVYYHLISVRSTLDIGLTDEPPLLHHSLTGLHCSRVHMYNTRELPGERDNARNNAGCMKARKTTHGLDGQHQDVDRTPRGRVSQNDRGQG